MSEDSSKPLADLSEKSEPVCLLMNSIDVEHDNDTEEAAEEEPGNVDAVMTHI